MRSRARLSIAASLTAAIALLIDSGHAAGSVQDPAEAVTLRMIVVSSAEAAQRIVERLNGGESFAALAKTESTGPSADGGGWLGKVPLSQLRPEVQARRAGRPAGQLDARGPDPDGVCDLQSGGGRPVHWRPRRSLPRPRVFGGGEIHVRRERVHRRANQPRVVRQGARLEHGSPYDLRGAHAGAGGHALVGRDVLVPRKPDRIGLPRRST